MTAGSLPEGLVERCVEEYERVLAEIYDAGLGITRGDRLKAFRAVLAVAAPHYEAELARVTAERDRLRDALQNVAICYCAMHDKPNVPRYDPEIEFCQVCAARAALGGTAGT